MCLFLHCLNSVAKEISSSKIIGFASDGASVMVGKENGVAARLRKENPFMLNIHCIAHRLALASHDASSSVPYCKNMRIL